MRFDRFTIKAQEVIQEAQAIVDRLNHQAIEPEHMLLAMVEQRDGVTLPILQKLGVDPRTLSEKLNQELERIPQIFYQSKYLYS